MINQTSVNPFNKSSKILDLIFFREHPIDNSKLVKSIEVHDKSMGCEFKAAMITTDDVDDMPNHLRCSIADHFKVKGNELYKQSQFNDAISF